MCVHDRSDDYLAPDGYKRCRTCHRESVERHRERVRNGVRYVSPPRVSKPSKPVSRRKMEEDAMNLRALELMGRVR